MAAFSSGVRANAPSDRLRVACIGLGGMGTGHLRWLNDQPDVRIAALCDVDASHLRRAAEIAPDAATASDFRDVVGRRDVDAVFVATPDHWHGLVSVAAARGAKHVYCEKPLANSIGEGRAIVDAVEAAGVVAQTGSHERSNTGAAVAKKLVAEGRLGQVRHVEINLPNADEHLQQVERFTEPPADQPPPDGLDYDFWLGHTPASPYNEKRCHFWWRFHSRYGGGEITDRGAHVLDLAHMILGLDETGPTRIEATGRPPQGDFFDTFVNFEFELRYAGGLKVTGSNTGPRGLMLKGDEGQLFVGVHGCDLKADPVSILDGVDAPRVNAYDVHRRVFLDAVCSGGSVAASAQAGHRTASACHLINLAIRAGRPLKWDPATELTDDAVVNARLTPKMRGPWSLEA